MKRTVATVLIVTLLAPSVLSAIDGDKAAYFGGTASAFPGAKDPVEGLLDTTNADAIVLTAKDKPYRGQSLRILYKSIEDLEYGQKAGRRVGAAVATTVLLGPIGLLSLFSKKRKHYLTIGFKDEKGTDQVAVIELGKDLVRATLPIVKTRSGKDITYQDEEARKDAGGGK
jgi:hypothetical protein